MIFILTFNLVVVSGLRAEKVMNLARERLSTIGMGFTICIFTSLLLFPIWASDELHNSVASNFEKLASCVEGESSIKWRFFIHIFNSFKKNKNLKFLSFSHMQKIGI